MATTRILGTADTAPAVRWEPCREFHDDPGADVPSVCAGCGWPLDDHDLLAAA